MIETSLVDASAAEYALSQALIVASKHCRFKRPSIRVLLTREDVRRIVKQLTFGVLSEKVVEKKLRCEG